MKNAIAFIVAFTVIAQAQVSFGQKIDNKVDNWHFLGSRSVDYTLDRDVLSLEKSEARYTGLKFKVKSGTLNMHKVTVHFENGDMQDIEFPAVVNRTNDGGLVDLAGNSRNIEKVTFWYDTKNSSDKKGVVEVWGKK